MATRKVHIAGEPKTLEEASRLAGSSHRWRPSRPDGRGGTRFDDSSVALLRGVLTARGWTEDEPDEYGERWRHASGGVVWSFVRAVQITLHAMAGHPTWCGLPLGPMRIASPA